MTDDKPVACGQCGGIVVIDHDEYDDSWWPICTKCDLTTERTFGSLRKAVRAWNRGMKRDFAHDNTDEELRDGWMYYQRSKR